MTSFPPRTYYEAAQCVRLQCESRLAAARWLIHLQEAVRKRGAITDQATRTRWREYVRVVLYKIRAARRDAEPPPGARLHAAVGKALAYAGYVAALET